MALWRAKVANPFLADLAFESYSSGTVADFHGVPF